MFRVIASFFLVLFVVGCGSTQPDTVTYETYTPTKSETKAYVKSKKVAPKQQKIVVLPKKTIPKSGSIKGNITKLIYTNGLWQYEVKGLDTSNNKLPYAKFTHKKKLAQSGDFVYAIVKDSKLQELFLIKRANFKKKEIKKIKKHKKVQKKRVKKSNRTRKKQIIGVPTTESISL